MNAAQKTPVSLLQELCTQEDRTAEYKLVSVEGAVHAPTFMYKVQVDDVMATATGHSKKKAKHAAAKAVLERLLAEDGEFKEGFISEGVSVNAENLNEIIAEPTAPLLPEENTEDNSVGKLQEYCMKEKRGAPYYDTENEIGPPHEKIFTMICKVEDHITTGEGKSKRLAKRQAAAKMLEILNVVETPKENTNEDEALSNISALSLDAKDESESSVIKIPDSENHSHNDISATETMATNLATQPCDSPGKDSD